MLNARGVFRACRQLAVYRLKIVKTFPKTVLPSKCWHCVVLQLYLRGKIVFSVFRESHELIKQWLPQAEELAIPQVTHGLEYMNPRAVADGLALFFASHKL